MPRSKTSVKAKLGKRFWSSGLVDIHFHGAFGVDLMTASAPELNDLAVRLGKNGIAAFCPTTLSASKDALADTVERLGLWIQESRRNLRPASAIPMGIHLEGPFINPKSSGAHPPGVIRPLDLSELESLWRKSKQTLKILTVAPELLNDGQLRRLVAWSRPKRIRLSIGHTQATEAEARRALQAGFHGVTHAWNAHPFHHREPGILGAALGQSPRTGAVLGEKRRPTYVELIVDGIHVHPTTIRWTTRLQPRSVCFVSDCAPAAATSGEKWYSFGPIKTRFFDGACRTPGGHLAGGGQLLSDAFARWVSNEAQSTGRPAREIFKASLPFVTAFPLRALGLSARVGSKCRAEWISRTSQQIELCR